jgi:lycopene cyclase CruP
VTEYNPQRVGFTAGGESYSLDKIRGVLNLGVDPLELIELVKDKFVGSGGVLLEQRGFTRADVFDDAVSLSLTVRLQP